MMGLFKVLTAFLILFKISIASANVCRGFLTFQSLTPNHIVEINNGHIDLIVISGYQIPIIDRIVADKLVIEQATNLLRENPLYIQNLNNEDISLLAQVFNRYSDLASSSGFLTDQGFITYASINASLSVENSPTLANLNPAEILTYAVIEFNMPGLPIETRAKNALKRIRGERGVTPGISLAVQFRYNRILIQLVHFHRALGNHEAADRILNIYSSRQQ